MPKIHPLYKKSNIRTTRAKTISKMVGNIRNKFNQIFDKNRVAPTNDSSSRPQLHLTSNPVVVDKNKYNAGKWSRKYKKSIDCNNPRGFSQKQHCKYGRNNRKTQKKINL